MASWQMRALKGLPVRIEVSMAKAYFFPRVTKTTVKVFYLE